ncbi:hypothetical protein TGGT1_248610 [Toxoplasma gondii GT1]|uniref:Transmembrane protein n=2 Tax=Toxoplasma gondii TaxID=5811 RepID=S7WGR6_TOXGG|nr:hypothetical protein TGGT1_248610 [Toxoplasma gondii GT1]RQX72141.1 putative transmembrane protein [Toxoplasma gondii CAST]
MGCEPDCPAVSGLASVPPVSPTVVSSPLANAERSPGPVAFSGCAPSAPPTMEAAARSEDPVGSTLSQGDRGDTSPASLSPRFLAARGKGGKSSSFVEEAPPASAARAVVLGCFWGCLRKVFSRTRWHYLFFISLYSVLIGPLYLNWAPLRQVLFRSGAYSWECDAAETDPTSLVYVHPQHDTCVQQRLRVGHLFTVCAAADYGFSFFGGLVMDVLGPKVASLLGSSLMLSGWLLIAVSTEAVQVLVPGFVLFGLGIDMAFYGTLSVAALFPGHENAVMAVVVAMRALSYMTPVVLDSLVDSFPHLAVMLGFGLLGLLPAVLIALVYAPWKPFPKASKVPAAPHGDTPFGDSPHRDASLSALGRFSSDLASFSIRRSSAGVCCASCGRPLAPETESLPPERLHEEESFSAANRVCATETGSVGSPYIGARRGLSGHSAGQLALRCRACRGSEGFPEGGLVGELSADLSDEQRLLEQHLGQFAGRGAAAEGALAAAAVAVRLISGESSLVGPPAVLGESREDREERGRSLRERVEDEERRTSAEVPRKISIRELAGRGDGGGGLEDKAAAVRESGDENGTKDSTTRFLEAAEHAGSRGEGCGGVGRKDSRLNVGYAGEKVSGGEAGAEKEKDAGKSGVSLSLASAPRRMSANSSAFSTRQAPAVLRCTDSREERLGSGALVYSRRPSSALSSYSMASATSVERAPSLRHYPRTCRGRLGFLRDTLKTHPYVVDSGAFVRDFICSPMYLPVVPYFTISLIRAVYFNDASEDLVPHTLRFLHIVLGFVFVAPPFAGLVADSCGIIVCMLLINTCGTLVIVAAFVAYQAEVLFFEYLASFMFMLNMALMTNQVYFYVADTFPQCHLGKLCGFACTVGGVISLCVTAMFEFSVKHEGGFTIMLSLLCALSVVTYLLIWMLQATGARTRRRKTSLAGHPQGDSEETDHRPGTAAGPRTESPTESPMAGTQAPLSRDSQPIKSLSATYGLASDSV